MVDLVVVLNIWVVKIGTNLLREENLVVDDDGFQLQQREAFLHRCRLSTIVALPILESHVCVQPYMDALLEDIKTYWDLGPITRNKWESTGLMDRYFVVGVTSSSYPCFGVIINIVSEEDIA